MCGIVGFVSNYFQKERSKLKIAADTLAHRGPDSFGEWWSKDGKVGFAHRRLSIIDITDNGKQPMVDEENKNVIIFNGEIYNHRDLKIQLRNRKHSFFSKSDTEVLLKAYSEWGVECVEKLNGMFAFAIYDLKKQTIYLARDRAGEKPLFYYSHNGVFQFASELKAIMLGSNLSHRINRKSLNSYLKMGFVPGNQCILKGFNKLPPAHVLSFNLQTNKKEVWRYWEPPNFNSNTEDIVEEDLLNELEILLEKSVKKQLIADVPLGILLSGGVDSSLITAMASRSLNNVKTFCVSFPGQGNMDEKKHARLISEYFSTDHIELDAMENSVDIFPILAKQFDEPIVDSSMIPTFLLCQMVRKHCKVALGGDGGDELFGGYNHYSRLLWMQKHLSWMPSISKELISYFSKNFLSIGTKGRNYLRALNLDFNANVPLIASYFDLKTRLDLLNDDEIRFEQPLSDRTPNKGDFLQRMTKMDFENYLPEDILVKVDRASMANSLELRSPFLDKEIIEFSFGRVPSPLKASYADRKILLKKLAKKLLPKEFDLKRKQGFSIPLGHWLSQSKYKDFFHDVLLDSDSIFQRPIVEKLFEGQKNGKNNSERLFSLVIFELWRRYYSITL